MPRRTKSIEYFVVWRGIDEQNPPKLYEVVDTFQADDRVEAWQEVERRRPTYANELGEGTIYLVAAGTGRALRHEPIPHDLT